MSQYSFNLEELLKPIEGEKPEGNDIRLDSSVQSSYYTIKDARNGARALEREHQFDADVDLLSPWYTVAELAEQILKNESKDLEISAWFAEALVRIDGIHGLKNSIELINGVVENFWEGLYPEPDEDGLETKVAPISGLGDGPRGTLLAPMRSMPVTQDLTGEEFTFWQYQQARDASKITDEKERQSRFETMGYSFEDVENAIKASGAEYYISLVDALETTAETYKTLNNTLRTHCGADAPPSSQISKLLEELVRTTRFLSQDLIDAYNAQQAATAAVEDSSTESSSDVAAVNSNATATVQISQAQVPVGAITNREDALKQLSLIADYFRMYEPHTPLAATLDRAVQWGRMTLPELIMELIPDQTAKALYSQLTGVITDGSSTEKYIPPPQVTPTSSSNQTTEPVAEAPAAPETSAPQSPEPQSSNTNLGW